MTKHTPGPWKVIEGNDRNGKYTRVAGTDGWGVLADCGMGLRAAFDEQEANARLIAAAPDMLALLQRIMHAPADTIQVCGDTIKVFQEMRSLLARVEGNKA